jgi:hypothetical protein
MRFKKQDEINVVMLLSDKEVTKYKEFDKENVITDFGMARTITNGKYKVTVKNITVDVTVELREDANVYYAEGLMNDTPYFIVKDRPIRKYDVFRALVENYENVQKTVEK